MFGKRQGMALDGSWRSALRERDRQGELRKLRVSECFQPATEHIDFFSNDYLGFARSPALHQSIMTACATMSPPYSGATGSRLLSGSLSGTAALEDQLASFFGTPATLLFSSGYQANLSVCATLPRRGDVVWYDAHIHASVKDGLRLGYALHYAFRHNDVSHLEAKLKVNKQAARGRQYVIAEAVYSMHGDECPLADLIALCAQYDAQLILDEAHSTGVFGERGEGMAHAHDKATNVIRIHTFGKALGVQGACVAGSKTVKEYLVNYARPFIYTTATAPYLVMSIQCALNHLRRRPTHIRTLKDNISFFTERSHDLSEGLVIGSRSPIQSFVWPSPSACRRASEVLLQEGFCLWPILSPTVKRGQEHLRVCLHAFNTQDEISRLVERARTMVV